MGSLDWIVYHAYRSRLFENILEDFCIPAIFLGKDSSFEALHWLWSLEHFTDYGKKIVV